MDWDKVLSQGLDALTTSTVGAVADFVTKDLNPLYWYEQNRADNMSEENRNFQREMTEKSYKYALENWKKEFQIESDWNKATNQVSLLRAAGINPAVSQAAMNGTINMPSAVGGNATAPQAFEGVSHSDSAFMNNAKGLNTSILNDDTKELINSEIKVNLAKAKLDDVYTSLNEFALSLEKEFGSKKYKGVVDNLVQDLANKVQDVATNKSLAANYDADTMNKMLQGPLIMAKRSLTENEYKFLQKQLDTFDQKFQMDLKLSRASANQANASAENLNAQTETENQSREVKLEIYGFQRDMMRIEKNVKDKTAMQQALANLQSQQWINKKLVEEVRSLYKQNRYADAKAILDCINQATESYLDLSKAGYFQTESINNLIGGFLSRSKNAAARSAAKGIYSSPNNSYNY